jgi:diguanylate cyclase (GGDEF)-like protein
LSSWEVIASRQLRALRLDRVRNKILAFSVLATLIPSIVTAWLAFSQSKKALTATISTELVGVSSQAANELALWLKTHQYDLRVFSNSSEVSDNLERLALGSGTAVGRLGNYLTSLRGHFPEYRELVVFDATGRRVASSPATATETALPNGWQSDGRKGQPMLGRPIWSPKAKTMVVVIAVPVQPNGGRIIGAIGAKLDLAEAHAILRRAARGHSGKANLIEAGGDRILDSRSDSITPPNGALDRLSIRSLSQDTHPVEYTNPEGTSVIGMLWPVPGSSWGVVAELPRAVGYEQVNRLRNITIMVLAGLFVVVGLMAYLLGLLLVRPLDRLTAGAKRVAAGEFGFTLPVLTGGELGYLTEVFNNMITRLGHSMEEAARFNETLQEKNVQLERLSLTDPLTGLFNRRHLMTTLEAELHRSGRTQRSFSILMLDVDHFKTYNDAFGHQAGDEALIKVARVLTASLREIDCPARYGGEEFLTLLPDTAIAQASEVAERIRNELCRESFTGGAITLSIGVAEFPTNGANLETLIASADAALYHAKRIGRDRVVRADWADRPPLMAR